MRIAEHLKQFLGDPNELGTFVYPDGSQIIPMKDKWIAVAANGKPVKVVNKSINYAIIRY